MVIYFDINNITLLQESKHADYHVPVIYIEYVFWTVSICPKRNPPPPAPTYS